MISEKYLLNEGAEAPEGTVVVSCKYCGRQFAVPADQVNLLDNVCEACKEVADKEAAAAAAADMKSDVSDEKAAALGD